MPDSPVPTNKQTPPPALAAGSDSMHLWAARRWGARVRRKGEERWVDLQRPYALVGSDPRCDVQIEDSKLPSVVYLVVACGDRIEVWPTCPLAFPIWGRVSKNHVLLVGRSRVQFYFKEEGETELAFDAELEEDSTDITQDSVGVDGAGLQLAGGQFSGGQIASGASAVSASLLPTAKLILDWGRGPKHKSLNRNVSIIGEDHPSLIRLHHADVERCDHGVVCFGDEVWLIELHLERLGETEPMIRRVRPGDPSVLVGGIHLWVEGSEPIDVESLQKSELPAGRSRAFSEAVDSIAQATAAQATAGARTQVDMPLQAAEEAQEAEAVREPEVAVEKAPEPPLQDLPGRSMVVAEASITSAEGAPDQLIRPADHVRRVSRVKSTSHDQAESITMELTDRLLETNARKSHRQRVFRIAGIAGLVFAALLLILAILVKGVLPIIRSIYGS